MHTDPIFSLRFWVILYEYLFKIYFTKISWYNKFEEWDTLRSKLYVHTSRMLLDNLHISAWNEIHTWPCPHNRDNSHLACCKSVFLFFSAKNLLILKQTHKTNKKTDNKNITKYVKKEKVSKININVEPKKLKKRGIILIQRRESCGEQQLEKNLRTWLKEECGGRPREV